MLVWQERDRNEWATAIRETLTAATAPPDGPNAFALADPTVTEGILTAAGFADVNFTEVHQPVYYGPDGATAFDAVYHRLKFKDLIADLDAAAAADARTRGYGPPSTPTAPATVCTSTRVPGSSRPAASPAWPN